MSSASAFEEHFAREIIHSERTRMAVLAGVLAPLLAVFALLSLWFTRRLPMRIDGKR